MARNSANSNAATATETAPEAAPSRTEAIDVSPAESVGLIAAWDGVFLLLGGRVDSWEILPGVGIAAHGFTLNGQYDPETVLTDVNRFPRRVTLFPTIDWIMGNDPAPFAKPSDVQAYLTQYFKSSVGDGSTKVAKYIRDAAKAYRSSVMGTNKPGPRPQFLKKLAQIDVSTLHETTIDPADIEKLEAILNEVRAQAAAQVAPANA